MQSRKMDGARHEEKESRWPTPFLCFLNVSRQSYRPLFFRPEMNGRKTPSLPCAAVSVPPMPMLACIFAKSRWMVMDKMERRRRGRRGRRCCFALRHVMR